MNLAPLALVLVLASPCFGVGETSTFRISTLERLAIILAGDPGERRMESELQGEAFRLLEQAYQERNGRTDGGDREQVINWLLSSPGVDKTRLLNLFQRAAFQDPHEGARVAAVKGLGDLGNPTARPALERLLGSQADAELPSHASVREEAARSLGKLARGTDRVASEVARLSRVVETKPDIAAGAVDGIALCGINEEVVRTALKNILKNRNNPLYARIRVVQWFRERGIERNSLFEALAISTNPAKLRLSIAHALVVAGEVNSPAVASAISSLGHDHELSGVERQYALRLRANGRRGPEPSLPLSPAVSSLCVTTLAAAGG